MDMDYPTAVEDTIARLSAAPADGHAEQVAIELIRHTWQRLGPQHPAWDLLIVDVLNTRDILYPDRLPIVLFVAPPAADCAASARQLIAALLDRYEQVAQADGAFTRRLQYAAAAASLRRASQSLP